MSEFGKDLPFEKVSPESPCSKCGATDQEDTLHCDSCGKAIPHGQENFYPVDDPDDYVCLCEEDCDEFGPDDEEQICFVRRNHRAVVEARDGNGDCKIHKDGQHRRAWGDVRRHACGCPMRRGEHQLTPTAVRRTLEEL